MIDSCLMMTVNHWNDGMYLLPREVVASSVKYSMNILLYLDHLFQDDNFSLSSKTLLIKKSKITLLFEVKNFYFAAIYFKNFG